MIEAIDAFIPQGIYNFAISQVCLRNMVGTTTFATLIAKKRDNPRM